MTRSFVVGDVHGKLDLLAGLLNTAGILDDGWERIDRSTRVVQVGDLVNCVASDQIDDHRCIDHADAWLDDYLIGNHEHPHFGGPAFGGFFRDLVMERRLSTLNAKGLIKPCVTIDGILVSHAGLSSHHGRGTKSADLFAQWAQLEWQANPCATIFSAIGHTRGGWNREGGLLWSDWSEPKRQAFPQIVGHTAAPTIRRKGKAICIDVNVHHRRRLAGVWIQDGRISKPVLFALQDEEAIPA